MLLLQSMEAVTYSFYGEIARRYTECVLKSRQEEDWEAERASFPSLEEIDLLWAGK